MIKLNSEWNWNDIVIWRVAYWGKRKIETGKWFCKFCANSWGIKKNEAGYLSILTLTFL